MKNSLEILDTFYANAFRCNPENLRDNKFSLSVQDNILIKFAKGYPLGFLMMDTKEGIIATIKKELYSGEISNIINSAKEKELKEKIIYSIGKNAKIKEWFNGLRLYCDTNSFIDCSYGDILDITEQDEWAIDYNKTWKGRVYGQIVDSKIISRAAIKVLSESIADLRVDTDESHRGRGYAKSVVSYAVKEILESGMVAGWGTDTDNIASIKTAEAVGFKFYANDFGCIIEE